MPHGPGGFMVALAEYARERLRESVQHEPSDDFGVRLRCAGRPQGTHASTAVASLRRRRHFRRLASPPTEGQPPAMTSNPNTEAVLRLKRSDTA